MKAKISAIIISLCCYSFSMAQIQRTPEEMVALHKNLIKGSNFIFEGKVISQICFKGGIHRSILTCSLIQISKIYRDGGQIKLGTIKIISEQGGEVNGEKAIVSDGGPAIYKGCIYTFFGGIADSSLLYPTVQADNNVTLTMPSNPVRFMGKEQGADWDTCHFKTLEDLFSFFKQNGLTIQVETPPTISPSDSTKH